MKSGICPKCGSDEVYKRRGRSGLLFTTSFLFNTEPETYVCANCGYVEFYVYEKRNLERIANTWLRVGGEQKNPKR